MPKHILFILFLGVFSMATTAMEPPLSGGGGGGGSADAPLSSTAEIPPHEELVEYNGFNVNELPEETRKQINELVEQGKKVRVLGLREEPQRFFDEFKAELKEKGHNSVLQDIIATEGKDVWKWIMTKPVRGECSACKRQVWRPITHLIYDQMGGKLIHIPNKGNVFYTAPDLCFVIVKDDILEKIIGALLSPDEYDWLSCQTWGILRHPRYLKEFLFLNKKQFPYLIGPPSASLP